MPVTEQDKKSYYKYYLELMVEPPAENIQRCWQAPLIGKALPVHERNRLFEPVILKKLVIVLCRMEPVIFQPCQNAGVTGEMFDWWFAWHGLESTLYHLGQ